MKVRRLTPGTDAVGKDRIFLLSLREGGVAWRAAIVTGGKVVFGGDKSACVTIQEAEAEALDWVKAHGAEEITIVTNGA